MYRFEDSAWQPLSAVEELPKKKDRTLINALAIGAIAFGLVGWALVTSMGEPKRGRA